METQLLPATSTATSLPPVPESLRALCRRQLAAPPTPKAPSLRRQLRSLAESARGMQRVIVQRTQLPGSLAHVNGGWANGADWSRLLADFDHAIAALRAAWQQLKDSEPATQEVLQTWRQAYGIASDTRIDEDSETFWLLLMPALNNARGNAPALICMALTQWGAATARYFYLLRQTKTTLAYGPHSPSTLPAFKFYPESKLRTTRTTA